MVSAAAIRAARTTAGESLAKAPALPRIHASPCIAGLNSGGFAERLGHDATWAKLVGVIASHNRCPGKELRQNGGNKNKGSRYRWLFPWLAAPKKRVGEPMSKR
jgi:hypothetical protein